MGEEFSLINPQLRSMEAFPSWVFYICQNVIDLPI